MRSKAEVTTRYARAYVKARKKDKGAVLDEVVSVTGWSRDNARRRLTAAAADRGGQAVPEPGPAGSGAGPQAARREVLV